MPSPAIKPTSIALFPAVADRSTLISNLYQQHYLSPPLTPSLHHLSNEDQSKLGDSPPSFFPPSLPSLRQMLPHERRPDTVPTGLETHAYSSSAQDRHSQMDNTETLTANSSAAHHGAQSLPEPNRLLPVYTPPSLNGVPPPSTSMLSPILRRNKAHVASACVNCKKAHLACDANRPCRRCVSLDKQDSCVDVQHKRRGRPRLKDSAPATNSPQGERRPSYLHRHVSDNDTWKLPQPSSPFSARDPFRRDYHHNHHHHHRSYSQGSQSAVPRHHPYGNPTPSTSSYGSLGTSRTSIGYFDLHSPSVPQPPTPSYSSFPAPNSPNYYPYPNPHTTTTRQSRDPVHSPRSPYQVISTPRVDQQISGPPTRSQSLLPFPDSSHHALSQRDASHSQHPPSESTHYPHRPPLHRAVSTPASDRGLERSAGGDTNDSVTLPSLKDLGVPLR